MRVHSTLTSQAAARRASARRWLLSLAAVALLAAGSASPALAAHGGSHGGGGGHHSGGGGGSHHSGGGGGFHGGGHTGSFHGGGGFHGGNFRGGGFHGGFHGGFRSYYPFFPSFSASLFFGYPFPYWYYGPWGYSYDGYPYSYDGYYRDGRDGYYRDRNDQGALDLDLSPADTQVYVNGQYMGKVDDFDGWPQYLWLDPGTYDIAFYHEGFKTLERQVTIRPGQVIDWTDRMQPGPSTRPEDLGTHERRDARIEQDREMRDRADRADRDAWRDRRHDRYDRDDADRRGDADRRDSYRDDRGRDDARSGRLHLSIEPHDASVYLDGRFLGTADDVARMRSGLLVDPGPHTLSIVRPGRRAEEQRFDVKPGADLDLKFELKSE